MTITWQAEDNVEPIADTTIEGIANFNAYSVTSGCGLTYSAANMTVTVAAGSVLHNGTTVTVAGNTVTLVSDATNPRWTWIGIPSTGTAAIVSGTAAATPTVPEIGDYVPLALVYVQANLAIANNATYKLDKRVIYTGLPAIMTTAGDMVYASGANTPTRLAKGTANQALLMNSGATAPAWGSSLQSLMTTTGDTVYASSANTPSRLAAGTARQALIMNSGATAPSWASSLQSLMTATGDIVYASSANTPARLAVGSNGQVLTLASGIPSWAAASASLTTASSTMTANYSLATSMSNVTGLSISLDAGTWLVMANFTVNSSNQGATNYSFKLWDSTNTAAQQAIFATATFQDVPCTVIGIVSPSTTTTWRIAGASASGSGTGLVVATTSYLAVTNKASSIWAVKVA